MICCTCGKEKSLGEFPWKNKENLRKHTKCTICTREYKRKWYIEHRQHHINGVYAAKLERVSKNKTKLSEYLTKNPCSICGERDIVVLEFHHRNPEEKEMGVSQMMQSRTWDKIILEIEKCDVVCANCHKRIHNTWR